jgi:DNA repair protein RadA/Sms
VELQALTNQVSASVPARRSAQGLDQGRLSMLLAVLERRARISLSGHEVYASVVGGVKLTEPGADLGMCLALVSAVSNIPLPADLVVIGEVGLAGEVRQVGHLDSRKPLFPPVRPTFSLAALFVVPAR